MSLKAKLEAVIYAAEEPVTLAQLAALFADEALEWKAEQEAVSAKLADVQPFLGEEFAPPEPEPILDLNPDLDAELDLEIEPATEPVLDSGADSEAAVVDSVTTASLEVRPEEVSPEADAEATPDFVEFPVDAAAIAPAQAQAAQSAEAELEARRQARLREREVRAIIRQLLDELISACASNGRGVEIREIAGGYRMATKPECHDAVRLFIKSLKPALKLSLQALETLAVVAYKQPVTAPEVNEIRGVDSSGVFGSLLARKLIATAGRKPVIGRPILYKTTREFLLRFGLKDVSELPSMEEFEKMASIELDEPETPTAEDAAMKPNPALGPEFEEAGRAELEAAPDEEPVQPDESTVTTETAEMAVGNDDQTPQR
ncbi:MAG: SMC-Scp complex subunit ScpB [Terracidiphilus sp.]|jgi:segregation and condensation protein B